MGRWTEYEHGYHRANTVAPVLYEDIQGTWAVRGKGARCHDASQIRLLRKRSAPSLYWKHADKTGRMPRGGTKPKLSLNTSFKATQTRDPINTSIHSSADSAEYVFIPSSPSRASTLCSESSDCLHRASRHFDNLISLKDKALPPLPPPSATSSNHVADMPDRDSPYGPLSPLVGINLVNLSSCPASPTSMSPYRMRVKESRPKLSASGKSIPRMLDAAKRVALPKVQGVYRVGRSIFSKTFMNSGAQERNLLFSNTGRPDLGLRSMSQTALNFGRR